MCDVLARHGATQRLGHDGRERRRRGRARPAIDGRVKGQARAWVIAGEAIGRAGDAQRASRVSIGRARQTAALIPEVAAFARGAHRGTGARVAIVGALGTPVADAREGIIAVRAAHRARRSLRGPGRRRRRTADE